MKRLSLVALLVTLSLSGLSAQVLFGDAQLLNDDWQFKNRETVDVFNERNINKDWYTVQLPHDWSVEGAASPTHASGTGYLPGGKAWYRKVLNLTEKDKELLTFIYFGGVYCNSTVYVNGKEIGYRPNGYVSFMYELTDYLKYDGQDTLMVHVDHSHYADSRWYTGSGIYRDVYLIKSNPIHIDLWSVACEYGEVTTKRVSLRAKASVVNTTSEAELVTVEHILKEKFTGKQVGRVSRRAKVAPGQILNFDQAMTIKDPKMWGVETPNLYTMTTNVYQGKRCIDSNEITTGVRTVKFDPNTGFWMNGVNMKLKGVCLHHDAGALGAAVPKIVWRKRLEQLKKIGVNAIRMSHNPQDDDMYDLCDELGFLVMDEAFDEWEFPKRKWVEGWNKGKPSLDGYATHFNEWAKRDLADMVRRNRHHPSIILWSIGNEVDYPNDPYSHEILNKATIGQKMVLGFKPERPHASRYGKIAQELVAVVKEIDASRPTTGAMAGVVMSNETAYPTAVDVCGYNYTENRYEMDHATYPNRVIYGSENRHDIKVWKIVKDNDFIAGQCLWTGVDYLGESGTWPSRGLCVGLVGYANEIKPSGYYRMSLWSDRPMLYVGTTAPERRKNAMPAQMPVWNYVKGEKVKVICYTNCQDIVFYLNGEKLALPDPVVDGWTGAPVWTIPYEPGILTVEAKSVEGEKVTTNLYTTQRAVRLQTNVTQEVLNGRNDVAIVEVEAMDANGKRVYLADDMVYCKLKGDGSIIGMENSHTKDMTNHKTSSMRLHNGRLIVYVQSTADEGVVGLDFCTSWMETSRLNLTIK